MTHVDPEPTPTSTPSPTPTTPAEQQPRMTAGQWFILALLLLLNAAVVALLVLAVTGRLAL